MMRTPTAATVGRRPHDMCPSQPDGVPAETPTADTLPSRMDTTTPTQSRTTVPTHHSTQRFGIVTPTLNAERYLEDTLRSIWAQAADGIEIEHVLVDGGSTDGTLAVAERFPTRVVISTERYDQSRTACGSS